MAEKDYVARSLTIKKRAVFELKELYTLMCRWFDEKGYDWMEKEYKEIKKNKGKKLYILWWCEKKVNDYIRFHIDIEFFIDCVDVEVEEKKKVRLCQEGEIEIRFNAFLEKDYEDVWEGKPVGKFLREVYDKFIIGSRIKEMEEGLFNETCELMNEVKSFLGIYETPGR